MRNKSPYFTVYIPCHNYGKYLATAIQSVLNQTFEDFELILIDDASKDETAKVIKKFANLDSRIRDYRISHHVGLIKSSNFAIENAKGRFVMRLDADDWLQTFALDAIYSTILRNPDAQIIYCGLLQMHRIGGDIIPFEPVSSLIAGKGLNGAGVFIERKYFLSKGIYDEEFDCCDGFLLTRKCDDARIAIYEKPLYIYYRHPTSLTANKVHIAETRAAIRAKYPQL